MNKKETSNPKELRNQNYEITRICKKEKRASTCIKNFRDKRDNLEKGDLIKIPVIPYKRN